MSSQTELEFAEFDSNNIWNDIYQRLKNEASLTTLGDNFSTSLARDPENRRKNRYRDVSPYDHSRVVLSGENDYINASLIEVPEAKRKYILTQGPLDHTVSDFWQMIWEQKSKGIVMLNRVIEKGALKCSQYWPLGASHGYEDEMYFPESGLHVTLLREDDFRNFFIRSMELEHIESGEKREVLHFHYTTWPDFGVPSCPDTFLQFLSAVRHSGSLDPDVGPAVVHCSAGIGRSGTFCLVDSCLVVVESKGSLNCINVRESLIKMRSFRMGLIQTADQLRFSYLAILKGAHAILNGAGLDTLSTQSHLENHMEGPPPPPPERTSSLSPEKQRLPPAPLQGLLGDDEPPPLPPKPSPLQRQPGIWDSEDDDDEDFENLIDRDEDADQKQLLEEQSSESDDEEIRAAELLRHEIREARKKETMRKIQEMKERQRKSERWRPYRPFFTPTVYISLAVLVGLAGVVVYKYWW